MNWRIGVLALGLALCGCGGAGNGEIGNQPHLRTFNAVNGTTSVTVILKDASGNALNTTTAAALGSYGGMPDAAIPNENATGTIVSSGTPIFTSAAFLYRENNDYTLIAGGNGGAPYLISLNDNQGQEPVGSVGFRAIHAGFSTASVDVYLLAGTPPGVTGTPAFAALGSGVIGSSSNASTGSTDGDGYEVLGASTGTYSVLVTAHGSTTVIATTTLSVLPRFYYTAIVYDNGGNTAVSFVSDEWGTTNSGF